MSLNLYDKAVRDKFRSVYPNTVLAEPDIFFEVLLKYQASLGKSNNEPELPAISIYRSSLSLDSTAGNYPGSIIGRKTDYPIGDKSLVHNVRSIPIRLEYMVEVWSKTRSTLNDLISELVFWLKRKDRKSVV